VRFPQATRPEVEGFAKAWIEAVPLDSDYARMMRPAQPASGEPDETASNVVHSEADLRQRLSDLVDALADNLTEVWWKLNLWISVEPGTAVADEFADDLTTMPGWALLTAQAQRTTIEAARRYLEHADVDPSEWLGTGTTHRGVLSGYRAAALLYRRNPRRSTTSRSLPGSDGPGSSLPTPTFRPTTARESAHFCCGEPTDRFRMPSSTRSGC